MIKLKKLEAALHNILLLTTTTLFIRAVRWIITRARMFYDCVPIAACTCVRAYGRKADPGRLFLRLVPRKFQIFIDRSVGTGARTIIENERACVSREWSN